MLNNIRLYPWFTFFRSLIFWQAIWFLYFQHKLSAAEAILLAAVFDIGTTALEVPSGYLSDRVGRRFTLLLATLAASTGCLLLAIGGGFWVFAIAQICLGAGSAFASGTDNALLFESLDGEGRADEIQTHELRAWRFSFSALAVSALAGGVLAASSAPLAYLASATGALVAALIAWRFVEPQHRSTEENAESGHGRAENVGLMARNPTLIWFFGLTVAMYVLSHVPFVFGQPFIQEALQTIGLGGEAPIVSGGVSAAMMFISVATSWIAASLHRRMGVGALVLTALSMQIGLVGILALTNHPIAIAFLLLRMVPDSLARPFILARVQPILSNRYRATYLSFQSFCGRLILAGTLIVFSLGTTGEGQMSHPEIRAIMIWYIAGGLIVFAGLAATLRFQLKG
jgi:MFS family permease